MSIAKKKQATVFYCEECGHESSRWSGKCSACGAWNSMAEVLAGSESGRGGPAGLGVRERPLRLAEVVREEEERISTGLSELDGVLGGGLVPGSFILLGGEPGVGKSTLLLEIARRFNGDLYYFSGEESTGQIKMRAERMGVAGEELFLSRQVDLSAIIKTITRERPGLAVIDSIQTVYVAGGDHRPGSPSSLREAAMHLLDACKGAGVPVIVTGHLTKDGAIAGPRLLEHMVDTVLYFESDRLNHYRLLRAVKNRFGPAGETAIFEMHGGGLREVDRFPDSETESLACPGRVFTAMTEGSRAIRVEVQTLVSRAGAVPGRRMAEGLDQKRLVLLAAVLEKFLRLPLADSDLFANLAGGLRADEPALDLAICAALLSSCRETAFPSGCAFIGEVGLSGEVRPVSRVTGRVRELRQAGFSRIVLPAGNMGELDEERDFARPVTSVAELLADLGG